MSASSRDIPTKSSVRKQRTKLFPWLLLTCLTAGCTLIPIGLPSYPPHPGERLVHVQPGQYQAVKSRIESSGFGVLGRGYHPHPKRGMDKESIIVAVSPFHERRADRELKRLPGVVNVEKIIDPLDPEEHTDATLAFSKFFSKPDLTDEQLDAEGFVRLNHWLAAWLKHNPDVRISEDLTSHKGCQYSFTLVGPSEAMSERKSGHWEKLKFWIVLHPPFRGDKNHLIARFRVNGLMKKWPTNDVPPEGKFGEDPFPGLAAYLRRMVTELQTHYGTESN